MKKLSLLLLTLTLSAALAANPALAIETSAPFEGAIKGISDITTIAHLPGYGLNVNARYLGDYDQTAVTEQLRSIVAGLAGLVQGLDAGDWVGVAWRGKAFMDDPVYIVVRMKPGQPGTLEVFVNGIAS